MRKILIFPAILFLGALFFLKADPIFAISCPSVSYNGAYTATQSCTFAGNVDGVESGNLTINNGVTLTINAGQTVVWNPGSSVIINGAIAINKPGGQLRKSYLWMADKDGDGYASSTLSSQYVSLTAPAVNGITLVRRSTMIATTSLDYDDRSAVIYPGTLCASNATYLLDTYSDSTKIASSSSLIVSSGQIKSTSSGGGPAGYAYKKQITVSGAAAGTTTNYQMNLRVNKGSGTDSCGVLPYPKLLLHMKGTDATTTFTDSGLTPKTGTAAGTAQIDTAQSVFGGASGLFDGSTATYVSFADSDDWNFGSGDFTIDFRVRWNGAPGSTGIMGQSNGGGNNLKWGVYWNGTVANQLAFHISNPATSQYNVSWAWTPSADTWYHLAIVRSGNSWYLFVNGTQTGGTQMQSVAVADVGTDLRIGADGEAWRALNGWLDEVRISKGVARWISNFTLPSAEYSAAMDDCNIGIIYLANHASSWTGTVPNDIRFTKSDGTTQLDYWIASSSASVADVWVELDSISVSPGTSTFYLYYGKASETTTSNGENTFLFFDDFSGSLSKWTNPAGCAATITSGYMSIPSSANCDIEPVYATGLNYSDVSGYILEFRGKFSSGGNGRLQTYQRRRNANGYIARFWIGGSTATNAQEYTGGWGASTNVGANNMAADTWYNLRTKVLGSNNTFYVDGSSIGSITSSASLTPFTDLTFGLGQYSTAVQYDDVRVRKTTSTEPTWASFGSEETPTALSYSASGVAASTNLLTGISDIASINSFDYTVSAKPTSTNIRIQFSQNGTQWYNSSASLNGWDILSTSSNNISLVPLNWSTANFYYKVNFISTGEDTAILDEVKVNYSILTPCMVNDASGGCSIAVNTQDPGNICGTTNCLTGLCSGTSAVCGFYTSAQRNCATNYVCNVDGNCSLACSTNGTTCNTGTDCCSGNCYRDADSDGYGTTTGAMVCKASASLGNDCLDTNAAVKPGAPGFAYTDGLDNDCSAGVDNCTASYCNEANYCAYEVQPEQGYWSCAHCADGYTICNEDCAGATASGWCQGCLSEVCTWWK